MNDETWKIKLVFGLVLMFLVSSFFAFRELQYLIGGRTTDAQLIEVYEGTQSGGRRATPMLVVHYAFSDQDGNLPMRDENDYLPLDGPRPGGKTVAVQYLSGTKYASRVLGHKQTGFVVFFFVSLIAAGGFIAKLALEANEPIRKPKPGSRSR